ncbi:MAG: endonuclease/exonuclease/phosphatase family protein [Silicimonas sp.]|nr:endonuclease/exonuclease/phosphatase family protein [Silicimonas sp.]
MLRDILEDDPQVVALVSVLRAAEADVLVLGDVDYDLHGVAIAALAERIGGYPHRFARRPNRGMQSGRDLDGDGHTGGPGDAEGYGDFAGQGGMAVLSRFPIGSEGMRDFSGLAWTDLPGNLAVGDGRDPGRLSTTVHWDVPVLVPGGEPLHLLVWHATAPVFDGPEDRNGRRNHDEAAFWRVYLDGGFGNVPKWFALLGTANADPFDGESRPGALRALLEHPALVDPRPASRGATAAHRADGGVNAGQIGPPELDTVDWPDGSGGPGNLRVDYILPAMSLAVAGSGVLWPEGGSLGEDVARASRHRLIWVDVELGDGFANGG